MKAPSVTALTESRWVTLCFQRVRVHLADLCLLVAVFCFQAAFLPQSRRQRRILGVEQGLDVFQPLGGSSQVRLLLGVPAEAKGSADAVWKEPSSESGRN